MKNIGFVDYYIDEWHANKYCQLIDQYNEEHGTEYKVAYVWAELENSLWTGRSTDEWCAEHNATRCESIEELCALADHVLVLAPSDPQTHLGYAERVFSCKKNAYIDKTFAPNAEEAAKIFASARENGVKFFSSSALRYAEELAPYNADAKVVAAMGCGSTLDEYVIHPLEMIVKCLGIGATSVSYSKHADQESVSITYADDRYASILFAPYLMYGATVADAEGVSKHLPAKSSFFYSLLSDIFRFFETGECSFDNEQTMEVMRIRDAILAARDAGTVQEIR